MRVIVEGGERRFEERVGTSITSSGIAGDHAKCSFEVYGCKFIGKILPQSCDFSPATFNSSEARGEGSARIVVVPGERNRGRQKPGS